MTTPRIAARRLVFLLLLPGCYTWRPVVLAPNTNYQQHDQVRVERGEQRVNSVVTPGDGPGGASSSRLVFHGAWVGGDTLYGWKSDRSTPQSAVAVADVQRAEERRVSGWRTTLLAGSVMFAVLLGLGAIAFATSYEY